MVFENEFGLDDFVLVDFSTRSSLEIELIVAKESSLSELKSWNNNQI